MAYTNICTNSSATDTVTCASMGFCLSSDANALPFGYSGMLALGKWKDTDTECSYMMQMYLQGQLEPELVIDLNFDGEVSTMESNPSSSVGLSTVSEDDLIAQVTSYSASDEWALEVTSWTWDNNTYTPSEEDVTDIALLQSALPYIGVPTFLFIDMMEVLKEQGFNFEGQEYG
jgi:hypothetical protein